MFLARSLCLCMQFLPAQEELVVVHALGGLVSMKDAAKDIANTASAEDTDHIQITTKRNGVTISEVNLYDKRPDLRDLI